jgi:hypothetical protein
MPPRSRQRSTVRRARFAARGGRPPKPAAVRPGWGRDALLRVRVVTFASRTRSVIVDRRRVLHRITAPAHRPACATQVVPTNRGGLSAASGGSGGTDDKFALGVLQREQLFGERSQCRRNLLAASSLALCHSHQYAPVVHEREPAAFPSLRSGLEHGPGFDSRRLHQSSSEIRASQSLFPSDGTPDSGDA